jgi:hypothetical protein
MPAAAPATTESMTAITPGAEMKGCSRESGFCAAKDDLRIASSSSK